MLVEDLLAAVDDPETQRGKTCLIGWRLVKLPDGTWGGEHGASSLLPSALVNRRIVVTDRSASGGVLAGGVEWLDVNRECVCGLFDDDPLAFEQLVPQQLLDVVDQRVISGFLG